MSSGWLLWYIFEKAKIYDYHGITRVNGRLSVLRAWHCKGVWWFAELYTATAVAASAVGSKKKRPWLLTDGQLQFPSSSWPCWTQTRWPGCKHWWMRVQLRRNQRNGSRCKTSLPLLSTSMSPFGRCTRAAWILFNFSKLLWIGWLRSFSCSALLNRLRLA